MTVLSPLQAHRLWAPTYDTSPNPLLALERRTLARCLPPLEGRLIADVACGTGYWARYAAAQGARVMALDRCVEMLEHAPEPRVLSDAGHLPLRDGAADIVICSFALSYMPPCLDELARITRRGGSVFASDMHPHAVERGWTRSFRTGSEVVEIESRPYGLGDLRAPGLNLELLLEEPFGEAERGLFAGSGKRDRFEEARRGPAIFVARWIRL
jgi:SAM-dependent methyltransferase